MFVLHGVRGQGGMGVRRPRTSTKWTSFFVDAIYEIRWIGLTASNLVFFVRAPLFVFLFVRFRFSYELDVGTCLPTSSLRTSSLGLPLFSMWWGDPPGLPSPFSWFFVGLLQDCFL